MFRHCWWRRGFPFLAAKLMSHYSLKRPPFHPPPPQDWPLLQDDVTPSRHVALLLLLPLLAYSYAKQEPALHALQISLSAFLDTFFSLRGKKGGTIKKNFSCFAALQPVLTLFFFPLPFAGKSYKRLFLLSPPWYCPLVGLLLLFLAEKRGWLVANFIFLFLL